MSWNIFCDDTSWKVSSHPDSWEEKNSFQAAAATYQRACLFSSTDKLSDFSEFEKTSGKMFSR